MRVVVEKLHIFLWLLHIYGHGVILAEQYEGHLNGQRFADFVHLKFPGLFEESVTGKLFLEDGDPAKNNRKSMDAVLDNGARKFKIPARSPYLNSIENVFHNVKINIHT